MGEQLIFYILSGLILLCSVMVIATKNPVTTAMFLIATLFSVACLYAFLGAHFIAAIQVLVYAGAIMVLFLFVIMLLNLHSDDFAGPRLPAAEALAVLISIGGFLFATFLTMREAEVGLVSKGAATGTESGVEAIGQHLDQLGLQLFTKYLWPFELASFLILLAIISAVVIAKKDKPSAAAKSKALVAKEAS